jgi:hypothetical protein
MIKKQKTYLIIITPTINNLFISINSIRGHLYRTFNFASVKITAGEHRKRKIFAQEFGTYFGKYLKRVSSNDRFNIKLKGIDSRVFGFLEYYIKAGGYFNNIEFTPRNPYNGCRTSKKKRI